MKFTERSIYTSTLFLLFSLALQLMVFSQSTGPLVFGVGGDTLDAPWAGGMHNPQFSQTDLDQDGVLDLVIYDRIDDTFTTLLGERKNNQLNYHLTNNYKSAFDSCDCQGWSLMKDINCDGLEDVFCGRQTGKVEVYTQIRFTDDSISFIKSYPELQSVFFDNPGSVFSSPIDIPAIVDIDEDGDIDFLTFGVASNYVEWHRNLAMERFDRCDTLVYERETFCWGHFFESSTDNNATLNDTIFCELGSDFQPQRAPIEYANRSSEANRHAGSTLLILDLNGDAAYDGLIGDISFPEVYAVYNGGTPDYAYIDSLEREFPLASSPIDVTIFPACYYIDVDQDGVRDLLIAPNSNSEIVEDRSGVAYYQNRGEDNMVSWLYEGKGLFQNDQIEMGRQAYPNFWDYDGDGLKDLVIGNLSSSTSLAGQIITVSSISLYRNTGSTEKAQFQLVSNNLAALNSLQTLGLSPASGDLNGDGKEDLVLGQASGGFIFIQNETPEPNNPNLIIDNDLFADLDAGDFSAPELYDVDGDGDLDLLAGNRRGFIWYYENVGTPVSPVFEKRSENWGFIKIADQFGNLFANGWAKPSIIDSDIPSNPVLHIGGISGKVHKYTGIAQGLTDTLEYVGDLFDSDWGNFAAPAGALLNSPDTPVWIIGQERGGLFWASSRDDITTSVEPDLTSSEILLYPNPGHDEVLLSVPASILKPKTGVSLMDITGRIIWTANLVEEQTRLPTQGLSQGIYLIRIQTQDQTYTRKLVFIPK